MFIVDVGYYGESIGGGGGTTLHLKALHLSAFIIFISFCISFFVFSMLHKEKVACQLGLSLPPLS